CHSAERSASEAWASVSDPAPAPAGEDLPLGVIPNIEKLEPGLQRKTLAQAVVFLEGHIPVVDTRRPQYVSSAVSGRKHSRKLECRGIEINEPVSAHG